MKKKRYKVMTLTARIFSLGWVLIFCTFALGWSQSTSDMENTKLTPSEEASDILVSRSTQEMSVSSINQIMSIDFQDVPLLEAIKQVTNDLGMRLSYSKEVLPINKEVTVEFESATANEVIYTLLEGTGLRYAVSEKGSLIIFEYSNELPGFQTYEQSQQSVTGTVTDGNSGETLPGVNILVKGTTTGTSTDQDGSFELEVPSLQDTLVVTYIGYQQQEMPINGRTQIDVALQPQAIIGEEMVVVGYGEVEKATLTGSISSEEGDIIERSPATNVSNSLAGRLSGLTVVSRSGEPGADGSLLRIRGSSTLGDNSPLIVVDGIQNRSLDRLNPADIESITILKDASAAIYGSQAANGVILVKTKRGITRKPEVSVSFNQGINTPTVLPKMADAATYAQMVNEINMYRNRPSRFATEDVQKFKDGSDPWKYPNTDWFDATYKPFATQNYANASIRGGSDYVKYFVSLGSKYQDGNYRNSATSYSQINFRSNIDGKISENISLNIDVVGRQENRNYPTQSADVIFRSAMRSYPTEHAYWPNGLPGPDIERGENPVVMATDATGFDKDKRYVVQSNMKIDIDIPWIDGLMIAGNVSFDKKIRDDKLWQTPWDLYTWDGETYDSNNEPLLSKASRGYSEPRLTQTFDSETKKIYNSTISYKRSFLDKHSIDLLTGFERIEESSKWFDAFRRYYISEINPELNAGGDLEKDANGTSFLKRRLNFFGRANYDYHSKYLVGFVWRYDGSYIFPEDRRFGFFPGLSLGWRISEEDFWKEHVQFINDFKLRASWGQTGNDRIEPYQFLASYGFGGNYIFNENIEEKTTHELRIPNPYVTWEVASQTNIGIDLQMFNSQLSFTADYFYNYRTDILWQRNASVPSSTGLELPEENIGKVINQGFDFNLSYNNTIEDFSYQVSIKGGYSKNRIKFWDETPGVPEYQRSTGKPMNSPLLYKAIGIFNDEEEVEAYPHWENARPGDIKFEDVNNDGEINSLDRVRIPKTDLPTLTGGLNIDLKYKNLDFNILFHGSAGATTYHFSNSGLFGNFMQIDAEGRWTEDNPDATKPRAWNVTEEYWMGYGNNTYFLRSTDYIRLKNINIGYNLSNTITEKIGINNLRIYVSGKNIFTIDKLENYDPETNDYTGYPPLKVYNAGINLTF